jgi:hypothetical protein
MKYPSSEQIYNYIKDQDDAVTSEEIADFFGVDHASEISHSLNRVSKNPEIHRESIRTLEQPGGINHYSDDPGNLQSLAETQ